MSAKPKTDLDQAVEIGDWPNCSTPDCPAKVCFRFENGKCWPCTMGLPPNWYQGWADKPREIASREVEAAYWKGQL